MDPLTLMLLSQAPGLLKSIAGGSKYGVAPGTGGMAPESALNPLFGGLQAIPNLFQAFLGGKQLFDARKLEQSTFRPTYAIPGAQQEALATARNMAYGAAPGLQVAENNMGRGLAGGVSSALQSGGPEGLAAAVRMAQGNADQSMNLAAMQEQWRAQSMGTLLSQLNRQAEYQDTAWRKNLEEPYLNASEKSAQLRDAGYTNVNDSLYGLGGSLSSFAKQGMFKNSRYAGPKAAPAAKTGMLGAGVRTGIEAGKPLGPRDTGPEMPTDNTPLASGTEYNPGGEPIRSTIWDYNMGNDFTKRRKPLFSGGRY